MTLLYTKCKWCRNVQDTSALVSDISALVLKCLGFLRWCRNVLGSKCLRSEVSVHQTVNSSPTNLGNVATTMDVVHADHQALKLPLTLNLTLPTTAVNFRM